MKNKGAKMQQLLYFLFIVAADIIAAKWIVPVLPWWNISAPAGTLFIGPVLTIRDKLHQQRGTKGVIKIILLASFLSWCIGGITSGGLLQRLSIASAIAFIGSELIADTGIYALLEKKPFLIRVLLSNLISAPVDSALFIGLAFGFNNWQFMIGQTIVKILIGALWILFVSTAE